jgi:predicted NUDIX family phosphoesterase
MPEEEHVLVIPRDDLFREVQPPHGFGEEHTTLFLDRIRSKAYFRPRHLVEDDPSLKQVIPYMIVTDGSAVLLLQRLEKQTEARLRNLYSIGVGGHINPVDGDGVDAVDAGLLRELNEELAVDGEPDIRPLGYLNDDSNAVGSVHFGLVFLVHSAQDRVRVAEEDMMEGRFLSLVELGEYAEGMETWSRLLLDHLAAHPESLQGRER